MARRESPKGTFQITTLIAGALLLLILFVCAGYFFWLLPNAGTETDEVARLEAAYDRWAEMEPENFRYVMRRQCRDCPPEWTAPHVVTVRGGEYSASFPIPIESDSGELLERPIDVGRIDVLFNAINAALLDELDVTVGYDRRYGYPVAVTIQYRGAGPATYEIRDFEVLPTDGQ